MMAKNPGKCNSENTHNHQLYCAGPKKTVKSLYSAQKTDKTHIVNGNGPVKKKNKQIASIKKADDDLDEVLISKMKKEMYTNVQPNDLENMLFNEARKKEKIKNLLDTQMRRPVKNGENSFLKNSMDQFKAARHNEDEFHIKGPEKRKEKWNKSYKKSSIGDLDEKLINKTKKVISTTVQPKLAEEMLAKGGRKKSNKQKILNILNAQSNRRPIRTSGSSLREKMMEKLKAARFRYLNEKLYMSESKEAKELFSSDPTAFQVYHDGFQQQIKKWPINPLEIIIKKISKMPKDTKVADLGCGEGMLAKRVPQKVRSFDLVSMAEEVEVCDMAHTPLLTGEMDVAVYCLALMGTNLKEYFIEANRILKVGGLMKIAEVESRFQDVNYFTKAVESYGFKVTHVDDSHNLFLFFDFKKVRDLGSKRNKLPIITLNPCLYKKR